MDPSPIADGEDQDLDVSAAATEQVSTVAQLGWLAKGLLFVIIGFLGFALVDRDLRAKDADQGGALQVIAGAPAGRVLVLAMAVGLGLFSVWQLWSALVDDDDGLVGIVGRVAHVGIGLAYALLGYTALEAGIHDGGTAASTDGDITPTRLSAWLFAQPGGRLAVILIGAGTIVAGFYQLWRIWTVDHAGDIRTEDLPLTARRVLMVVGGGGMLARAVILAMAGVLFVVAAWTYDASEAAGLDESLRTMVEVPYGRWVLAATSFGLLLAGLYDMATFRRRKM